MKPDRNAPCPCGSGEKYKKCCYNKPESFKSSSPAGKKAEELSSAAAKEHFNFAITLLGIGQLDAAMASFRQALKIKPDFADAHYNLGVALQDSGQLDAAAESYRQTLNIRPDFAEARYNLGVVLQDSGQLDAAAESYRQTLNIRPDLFQAHNNLGNILRDLGQPDAAAASYQRALEIKPDYAEAYNNLGIVLQALGQLDSAVTHFRRALKINSNYAEAYINLSIALQDTGQLEAAVESSRQALKIHPDDAEAHNSLGSALQHLSQFDAAATSYRRALQIKPNYAEAHNNLGNVLQDLGQLNDAVKHLHRALEIKPDYAEAHNNLGSVLQDLGQIDNAVANYRRALQIKPDYAEAHSNLGYMLMVLGKANDAEISLSRAIELDPRKASSLAAALLHLPYRQDDPRFSQLESVYAKRETLPMSQRISLNFAMGKAMESIGQYDKSFSAYEEGNRLHYQGHPFDEAREDHFLEKSRRSFTADLLEKYSVHANSLPPIQDERVPVFIVGMPRSGSTLIEQILASHPAIFGAGELTTLGDIAKKAGPLLLDSPDLKVSLLALRKLGQEYLDKVWKLAPGSRYITDKMPGNYRYLHLIHLMMPNAKIIHSVRNPMDVSFSCYSLHFRFGLEYTYDLKTMGRQYLRYMQLMRHWHDVLPADRIVDMHYEDIVTEPEREVRRMLDYLGLPWNPACLSFHENPRAVRTASVTQVRKPIYSGSVARWKRFENHLSPLLEIIHPVMPQENLSSPNESI